MAGTTPHGALRGGKQLLFVLRGEEGGLRGANLIHLNELYHPGESKKKGRPQLLGFIPIASAIESCQKLCKGDGGTFTHAQINEYLGFFSEPRPVQRRGAR